MVEPRGHRLRRVPGVSEVQAGPPGEAAACGGPVFSLHPSLRPMRPGIGRGDLPKAPDLGLSRLRGPAQPGGQRRAEHQGPGPCPVRWQKRLTLCFIAAWDGGERPSTCRGSVEPGAAATPESGSRRCAQRFPGGSAGNERASFHESRLKPGDGRPKHYDDERAGKGIRRR